MKNNTMDWNLELSHAIKLEPCETHYQFLCEKAGDWVTCAVGTQCKIIPRDKEGKPLDIFLFKLGIGFFHCLIEKNWLLAKETLLEIEERSAFLIAELTETV